jgi:hypothetical protein
MKLRNNNGEQAACIIPSPHGEQKWAPVLAAEISHSNEGLEFANVRPSSELRKKALRPGAGVDSLIVLSGFKSPQGNSLYGEATPSRIAEYL